MMTPTDLAHLAGVLDALARVRVRETDEGTRLAELSISSPNIGLLRHVSGLTGVSVTTVRRTYDRVGCGVHCDEAHLHVESVTGRWQLSGHKAVIVLDAVRPYLTNAAFRDEVDAVLATTRDAPTKPATARKMRALGWDAA